MKGLTSSRAPTELDNDGVRSASLRRVSPIRHACRQHGGYTPPPMKSARLRAFLQARPDNTIARESVAAGTKQ